MVFERVFVRKNTKLRLIALKKSQGLTEDELVEYALIRAFKENK